MPSKVTALLLSSCQDVKCTLSLSRYFIVMCELNLNTMIKNCIQKTILNVDDLSAYMLKYNVRYIYIVITENNLFYC